MKTQGKNSYKTYITYTNNTETWNKLSKFLITFIVNNEIKDLNFHGESKNVK